MNIHRCKGHPGTCWDHLMGTPGCYFQKNPPLITPLHHPKPRCLKNKNPRVVFFFWL